MIQLRKLEKHEKVQCGSLNKTGLKQNPRYRCRQTNCQHAALYELNGKKMCELHTGRVLIQVVLGGG